MTTNFTYLTSWKNSWKNFWNFWNGPLCWNNSNPSPLLNVQSYWKSSKACAKRPSQILANNIDNGGEGDWSQNWSVGTVGTVGIKSQLTLTIFIFWTKFAQKEYFRSKTKNHHWILRIPISLSNKFQLKLKILIFGPKLPKTWNRNRNNM